MLYYYWLTFQLKSEFWPMITLFHARICHQLREKWYRPYSILAGNFKSVLGQLARFKGDRFISHKHKITLTCISLSLFIFSPLSGVRCCRQLLDRLICYSSPPSSVSCLLLPVSLLSCLLHISLNTVLPSQPWAPSSPPALLS